VGDDWQSIYRFAGADIAHMTYFHAHFGYTTSVALDESFRFGRRLLQASAQFVQKNPAQLRKTLKSPRDEGRPAVVIVPMSKAPSGADGDATRAMVSDLRGILAGIGQQMPEGGTVYLLGRYTFSLRGADLATLREGFPKLTIAFLTVHKSKGLQADFVIVLNANSGRFGFPSEIDDDPLLSMVLAEPDALEHAEERRLFYVALTRAKRRVFILTRETQRSAFVEELLGKEYAGLVVGPAEWASRPPCPDCGGTLVQRAHGKTGDPFWGCVNYPYCEGSARVCAVCQEGALVLEGTVYRCNRTGCAGREEVCPRCREGMLVKRRNQAQGTEFWACTKWKRDKTGCNFTRDVDGPRAGGQKR
jgi:DNA helicase-4